MRGVANQISCKGLLRLAPDSDQQFLDEIFLLKVVLDRAFYSTACKKVNLKLFGIAKIASIKVETSQNELICVIFFKNVVAELLCYWGFVALNCSKSFSMICG